MHFHWLVWVDHHEARLLSFNLDASESHLVKASHGHEHLHHHAGAASDGRAGEDKAFFEAIAKALTPAGEVILCGPGNAKTQLKHYLEKHHAALDKKIVKVETLDHPSEGQLLAHGRKAFALIDRMLPR